MLKKYLSLFIITSIYSLSTYAIESQITIPSEQIGFKITKHWKLTPTHDFIYLIENPTHAKLYLSIEINPTTTDPLGETLPSAPIKLTCGGKEFYISEYSPMGITVCTSNKDYPDIRFELIHLQGNPSEGQFKLEFK